MKKIFDTLRKIFAILEQVLVYIALVLFVLWLFYQG